MEQELTVDERDALLRVAEVVDDGKLRGDLERLAGGRGATTSPSATRAPAGVAIGVGAAFNATAIVLASAELVEHDDVASATASVLDESQSTVLTRLIDAAPDAIRIGDSVVNAGDTWPRLGRWLLAHVTNLADLPVAWLETFSRWTH